MDKVKVNYAAGEVCEVAIYILTHISLFESRKLTSWPQLSL